MDEAGIKSRPKVSSSNDCYDDYLVRELAEIRAGTGESLLGESSLFCSFFSSRHLIIPQAWSTMT